MVQPQINIFSTTGWQGHGVGEGWGDEFDLCCCTGDTCATSQPCASISHNSSCSEVNNRWVTCDLQQLRGLSLLLWHSFSFGGEKFLFLLWVTESSQRFSQHHFVFCKFCVFPTKFIVWTAFCHIPFWGKKVMMILNPNPVLKEIILIFYAVNLVLSSDATFLLILFLVPCSSAKIKHYEAWLVPLACSWYKWWQIQFCFLFLDQQLGVGSWTQFTWMWTASCTGHLHWIVECSSLCLPRVFTSMQMQIPSMMGHSVGKKKQLLEVFPDLAQEKLKSSQIKKEIKFDSINTFQSPCLAINFPLSGTPMPSAGSGIPLKRVWGITEVFPGESWMKEGPFLSCWMNTLISWSCCIFCSVPCLILPFPNPNLHRICEFLFLVNSWIPFGTNNLQWRWIHGMNQTLCWAIEHLISWGMSRAPVSLTEKSQGN